ncbi:hypothetical protein Turpa_2081 [Turneriella parva DSM 21527]|uniref:Uncharacterized protein n=2 Tax=Turneriella TaxID=338321 RepID=I4B620_TURPD|nr:hypothetical protein Turpa_2081 [Turneriella parva DSM 21527]
MTHACPERSRRGGVGQRTQGDCRAIALVFAPAMRHALFAALALLAACTQSGQVFEPTNNRAVTATTTPATYTFTLNINITTLGANHQNKPFSALLFRDGTLVAAQYNNGATSGTDMTSGAGAATLVMNGVDTNGCPTATPAALETGSYDLYFAVQYGAETVTITNPNGACGASGWIQSSTAGGNLYGVKSTGISINSNTTFNITNTNLAQFRQHTFSFPATPAQFACYVADLDSTAYAATMQPLSVYTGVASGTTTGAGGVTHLLPVGTYKYFCSGGADTNHFQSGDSQATGTFTVTHTGVTTLNSAAFTVIP